MRNKESGSLGEALAINYLTNLGYKIICQNYTNFYGEIDIIAMDESCLVFIEVKKRGSAKYGLPREAVTPFKQKKLRMTAKIFLSKFKGKYDSCRIDVVDILDGEITHIKNAV